MRIISNFHDYYDSLQTQSEPVYVRQEKVVKSPITFSHIFHYKIEKEKGWSSNHWNSLEQKPYPKLTTKRVGFCGKVYALYFYNDKFLEKEKILEIFHLGRHNPRKYYKYDERNIHNHFEKVEQENNNGQVKELFETNLSPIFLVEPWKEYNKEKGIWERGQNLRFNARLKETEFFRVFSVQQTFQEIEMFLGNLAWPEKNIPEVSDLDMALAKGFDKYSFRKDKQK